ncbi:trehalase family glycosidase [Zobellia galactanivorans]|uniref:MGH1-like glycoside hydrolase domain-containing protein n=1 Tax=Zobellia galactanivorans (strain DSM 12802 / CCUG 47099 / CIP 106680 / NCIMB 13871 / Dsij) TaxID=63186 RepID=UPI0026E284F0|nr:trehalase family glycosidase [Zobellia galactanivorans]MDO6810487.1 trehalase family glycosidase [Zobellia galactanivorans]
MKIRYRKKGLIKRNLNNSHLFFIFFIAIGILQNSCKEESSKQISEMETEVVSTLNRQELYDIYTDLTENFKHLSTKVIQPAEGYLEYPYLIPAGFYKQMWDWDGFFMGNYFVSKGKPEYLKYWALNLIKGIDEEGYVSGCATINGPRPIFGKFAMKPFLSQGVYLASEKLNDFEWVKPHYNQIKKVLEYREKTQRDSITGLFFWDIAMQSGADNNPALNYFIEDKRSFLAPDASTWQYKEYIAQSALAKKMGNEIDALLYERKAKELKTAINKILWSEEDSIFYTVDRETGDFYKRVTFSSFLPLAAHIVPKPNAKKMIETYLLSDEHMKAKYGFRTLSAQDPDYNNKNIIVPFSNWQGPVWPIANYIYSIGLKNYGYDQEVAWLGQTVGNLLLDDIAKYKTTHENYHADTGQPLAPSDDHVDEDGNIVGFISWNLCMENVLDGVVNDNWMLLEIK